MSSVNRAARYAGWLMGAVAVGVAFAIGGGAFKSAPAPSGPTHPPGISDDFPTASMRYLPDVTTTQLESWLKENDYRCEQVAARPRSGADHVGQCRSPSAHLVAASVFYEFDSPDAVRQVRAACSPSPRTHEEYCADLFRLTTEEIYFSRPAVRDDASAWVMENEESVAHTVLGGIEIQARPTEHAVWFLPAS